MEKLDFNTCPYYARITFNIEVFPMMQDGSIHPSKLTESDLINNNISPIGIFNIYGFNKEDCIKKVLESLNKVKYDE
jgi:hypothetical protein